MVKYFRIYIILATLLFTWCKEEPGKGSFAFFVADDRDLSAMQKRLYRPLRFKKMKAPISFQSDMKIWYMYTPDRMHYGSPYAMSLSKKSLGYIEIALKNQRYNSENPFIKDTLNDLEVGEYQLRIAYENKVLDTIYFSITPNDETNGINFDAPIVADNENPIENEADDIELYSK